jgi:8-oxo-dGTP diphosphatase
MNEVSVSVGLVLQSNKVLVAKRHHHQHQGGLWEFPGGKIEIGEAPIDALKRELKEEVNINIHSAQQVLNIKHDYSDKSVELIIFQVTEFSGEVRHCEGQEIRWVDMQELPTIEVPEANKAIVSMLLNES